MHDGVGQWIKSAVARAVMAGVGIASALDFFKYCLKYLKANKSYLRSNFTQSRHFYMIDFNDITRHRMEMPSTVVGTKRILATKEDESGWFCFATGVGNDRVQQRKVVCFCDACWVSETGASPDCQMRPDDTVDGQWWNALYINRFKVSKDRMGRSIKECVKFMKKLQPPMVWLYVYFYSCAPSRYHSHLRSHYAIF